MKTHSLIQRKFLSLLCTLALALTLCIPAALAESGLSNSSSTAEESYQTAAAEQLTQLTGTYQPLFEGATFDAKCDGYWHDAAAAVVGEAMADDAVALMKASIGSSIYGQEAIDAYTSTPENAAFCCGFIGGMATLSINGTQISGYDAGGAELFSHTYECIGVTYIGEEMGIEGFGGYTFQSTDADSGEYTYFIFLPDTISSTYHVEFRYGSDLEAMKLYGTGAYAYWLAAGISTDAMNQENDALLRQVISLFSAENLAEMVTEETSAQRESLVGTWDASQDTLNALRTAYDLPDATMYCVLNADGSGETYVDMEGTGEFTLTDSYTFYAYDNDGNAQTQSGVYIAVPEESAQISNYDIVEKDGQKMLSFYAEDGTASWILRADSAE